MTHELLLGLHYNFSESFTPEAAVTAATERLVDILTEWRDGGEVELTDEVAELGAHADRLTPGEEKSFLMGVVPLIGTVVENNHRPQCDRILRALRMVLERLNERVAAGVQSMLGLELCW